MKKRVADIITETLVDNGIVTCFSVVGGGAMHLNNAFALNNDIEMIFNHHEQACSMAAESYARTLGRMAAVCVTSGPGGLNTLTGVEGAWVDSIPMLIISGHPRYETTVAPTGLDLRYRGVQEFDIITSVKNMTKYAKLVTDPLSIKKELQKAIDIALSGRRGPVWIDVPLNVQSALVEIGQLDCIEPIEREEGNFTDEQLKNLIQQLEQAKRPCLLTGSGLRTSHTVEQFRKFSERLNVPVVGGALQADIMSPDYPFYYGMSGNVGPRAGNFILQNADLIVVFGNSLAIKQTGFNQEAFAPNAKIIMIDINLDEAKKPGLSIDQAIHIDLNVFFHRIEKYAHQICVDASWIDYCEEVYRAFPVFEHLGHGDGFNKDDRVSASLFWKTFMEYAPEECAIALGNSSSIVGALQHGIRSVRQRINVNYACGSMGDDLPEAVGMSVALDKKAVVCATGDGSIMMNLQELQTIKHYGLPIKVVIFSNKGYGALRQTFQNFFNGTYTGCDKESGVSFPSFQKIAGAFELEYHHCHNNGQLIDSVKWLLSQPGACILEIDQLLDDPIFPKVISKMNEDGTFETPGLHDMYPFITEEEMDKLMLW